MPGRIVVAFPFAPEQLDRMRAAAGAGPLHRGRGPRRPDRPGCRRRPGLRGRWSRSRRPERRASPRRTCAGTRRSRRVWSTSSGQRALAVPACTLTNAKGVYADAHRPVRAGRDPAHQRGHGRPPRAPGAARSGRTPWTRTRACRCAAGRSSSWATAASAARPRGSRRRWACASSRSRRARSGAPTTAILVPGTGDPDGSIPERIVGLDGLHAALAEADFVSLSVPLTPALTRV